MIKLPDSWLLNSFTLPVSFYENKGDVARCANYVVINLYVPDFHKPKPICVHILYVHNRRNTCCYNSRRETSWEPRRPASNFYRSWEGFWLVPLTLVWQTLRAQQLPKCYTCSIQNMYNDTNSSLLFNAMIDLVTKDVLLSFWSLG